jgi:hypothetical protein
MRSERMNALKGKDTRNLDGTVTAYGFACGYIQRHGEMTLEKAKDYHLRYPDTSGVYRWESFQYLTEARKRFSTLEREATK